MREAHQLIQSRARVKDRYALLPLDGVPPSRLPHWPDCEARVLAAPAMGAEFVQYLIDVPAGKGTAPATSQDQTFGYVLNGTANITAGSLSETLEPHGFFFVPAGASWSLTAKQDCKLLLLRKLYEPFNGLSPKPVIGSALTIPATPFLGNEHARLQKLLPDDLAFDMEMNIFTFDTGHSLPYVETHVMEHGLYFLQGKGMYFLGEDWMEVEPGDFIWMGPYCPQCFYATGPTPSKYLYYKNVNREIPLKG